MLFMLLIDGKDPANFTSTEFEAGIERLSKAVNDGQVRRLTGNGLHRRPPFGQRPRLRGVER